MREKLKRLYLFLSIFLFFIVLIVWIILDIEHRQEVNFTNKNLCVCNTTYKIDCDTNISYDKYRIVDWVYRNSRRISYREAEYIVNKTFEISKYPLIILAIFQVESSFNPKAISRAGAIGLGQILPSKEQIALLRDNGIIKDVRDLFDIETNIKATNFIFMLKLKLAKSDLSKALTYYFGAKNKVYLFKVFSKVGELYLISRKNT